jgi:hypothetical protein
MACRDDARAPRGAKSCERYAGIQVVVRHDLPLRECASGRLAVLRRAGRHDLRRVAPEPQADIGRIEIPQCAAPWRAIL